MKLTAFLCTLLLEMTSKEWFGSHFELPIKVVRYVATLINRFEFIHIDMMIQGKLVLFS